ncbi:hypothetical protein FB45DRAFT_742386 [Roridomyces roridus]|uniref:GATA-type domain-containing protein n=1 Tax=Roridomyces roridus TaxID=1738132 RepID=A0AAD7C169_9AGAR|nr:hypothetical protein FB45DRAFT_742386 [Roridomyces roridus]
MTDEAGTKLGPGVRRQCFNCRTTETSTWRRSNLSQGKMLCNKCGLYERTHSRSRPDQLLPQKHLADGEPVGKNRAPSRVRLCILSLKL